MTLHFPSPLQFLNKEPDILPSFLHLSISPSYPPPSPSCFLSADLSVSVSGVLQSVPFRGELVGGLSVGRSVTVRGETNQNADRYKHITHLCQRQVGGASEPSNFVSLCVSVSASTCECPAAATLLFISTLV